MTTTANKTRSWVKLLLVVAGLFALACLLGVGGIMVYGFMQLPAGNSPGVQSSTYSIEYYVTTDWGEADLTYANSTGDTEQVQKAITPWSYKFQVMKGQQTFLYVSAQTGGDGDITCEIRVDGVTVKRASSHGEYVIATCSGSIR